MNEIKNLLFSEQQQNALDDFLSLESEEERLEWLMERNALHQPLPESEKIPERRIPGCPSGLWLYCKINDGKFHVSTYSESAMVQGITSFICDLYNERSAQEILDIGTAIPQTLKIERLLSQTRKRALAVLMDFIILKAQMLKGQ